MSKIPKTLTKISHMNHDVLRFTWISEDLFADFRLRDKERNPGVYVHVYRDSGGVVRHYIGGSGGNALTRARSHLYPRVDGCIGMGFVVGAEAPLTKAAAFAAERILYQIASDGGLTVQKEEPNGGVIGLDRYTNLRTAVAKLALALARAGILPLQTSPRAILAGPRGYVPGIDADSVRPLDTAVLRSRGVNALVAIDPGGHLHLQSGSRINRDTSPEAAAVTHMRRLEAIYGGGLSATGEVLEPISFDSWPALSKFCLGSKVGSARQWRRPDGSQVRDLPAQAERPRDTARVPAARRSDERKFGGPRNV